MLEGGHTHCCASHGGESREPLVALQALGSYRAWEGSLPPLQGRLPLASPPTPGEQPGEVESPLATPQLLQLPVKGRSSPSSPQGLLPSLLATILLPAWLNMKQAWLG